MTTLRALLLASLTFTAQTYAENIQFNEAECQHWVTINDNVMGGISNSQFYHADQHGIFEGFVSLANNGGFASVRRVISPQFNNGSIIVLTIKGDGRRYQFRLKTHGLYEGAAYVAKFDTQPNRWQQIQLKEQDFTPRFRGRFISGAPRLKFGDAMQLGLLINDKVEGPFKLHIQAIDMLDTI